MLLINKSMISKINKKFFYGWTIVGIGGLGIFASGAGQSHTFSPFIPVISDELNISSTSISTAYMIATLFTYASKWKLMKIWTADCLNLYFTRYWLHDIGAASNF